jgi:RimJ/RimL family protein N-acetyltransferase
MGNALFKGKNKTGQELMIRYPLKGDAEAMCHYMNALSSERTYIRFQGEKVTLEEEKRFLRAQMKRISNKVAVQLFAFAGEELIGIADIDMSDRTDRHVGELGISISKDFRGEGIGALLLKFIINEAIKYLPELEIISLSVFSNNVAGISMYRKFGFIEYGSLPKGVKLHESYVDRLLMYKIVQSNAMPELL